MERDHRAYDLFRRGLSYRQIGAELGFSHSAASDAVRRAAKDNAADPLEQADARQAVFDRLQDYRRAAQRVLTGRHYVVNQAGKIVRDDDGRPLADGDPVLRALNTLIKIEQEENRLRDLYPPTRSRVEVITEDMVDGEIARLTAELGEADARTPGTGAR
jgi:hypothetical protein